MALAELVYNKKREEQASLQEGIVGATKSIIGGLEMGWAREEREKERAFEMDKWTVDKAFRVAQTESLLREKAKEEDIRRIFSENPKADAPAIADKLRSSGYGEDAQRFLEKETAIAYQGALNGQAQISKTNAEIKIYGQIGAAVMGASTEEEAVSLANMGMETAKKAGTNLDFATVPGKTVKEKAKNLYDFATALDLNVKAAEKEIGTINEDKYLVALKAANKMKAEWTGSPEELNREPTYKALNTYISGIQKAQTSLVVAREIENQKDLFKMSVEESQLAETLASQVFEASGDTRGNLPVNYTEIYTTAKQYLIGKGKANPSALDIGEIMKTAPIYDKVIDPGWVSFFDKKAPAGDIAAWKKELGMGGGSKTLKEKQEQLRSLQK